jgi:hypothetical protein
MFTNRFSKIFVVVLVLVAALATVSFAAHSATVHAADRSYDSIESLRVNSVLADRSYDVIEQMRLSHPATFTLGSYDQIEALRVQRGIASFKVSYGYDAVEQMRLGRAFSADRAYDQIETLRLSR